MAGAGGQSGFDCRRPRDHRSGVNGASFVNYGHAFSSMIMAGLWALALACYLGGAILAYRPQSIAPAKPQLALFSLI